MNHLDSAKILVQHGSLSSGVSSWDSWHWNCGKREVTCITFSGIGAGRFPCSTEKNK